MIDRGPARIYGLYILLEFRSISALSHIGECLIHLVDGGRSRINGVACRFVSIVARRSWIISLAAPFDVADTSACCLLLPPLRCLILACLGILVEALFGSS